ncbi:MAG: FtsX-like permease family protein [Ignavibacteriaceae bacterium]|jgi:putative ABC transport system permease protein
MKIPIKYILRNFKSRKLTTLITVSGVALVVFVFAAVLMMAYGIQSTLSTTGSIDNVKIVRKAANGEISSLIGGETQNVIRSLPHIAVTADGKQIISNEPVVIINLRKPDGAMGNVTIRGIAPVTEFLRPQVKIEEGRMFEFGVRELIVGVPISKRFVGAKLGDMVRFAGDDWKIVGTFSAEGSGFESEMFGDALQLLSAFNRGNTVSSVTLKLDDVENFESFKKAFEADRRLQQFVVKTEQGYFEEQSELMAMFIRVLGIFVTVIFSFGAIIGAMITMYSAVSNRTVEVGTFRALGFKRRSILAAFLMESIFISLFGGALGILLASLLSFFSISTLNFGSFAELEFSFSTSPSIIISSLIFALAMGIIGGFLPSVRAARMNIVNALRAG